MQDAFLSGNYQSELSMLRRLRQFLTENYKGRPALVDKDLLIDPFKLFINGSFYDKIS